MVTESSITALYNRLSEEGLLKRLGFLEPLEHTLTVDRCRRYWKPKRVKVALIAESHVLTSRKNFNREIDLSRFGIGKRYPTKRVNFVYCLGQESDKAQFWKILSASIGDFDFSRLLMTMTRFDDRMRHKIAILEKMRKRGIWLMDASAFALYPKDRGSSSARRQIITRCWDSLISPQIRKDRPKRVLFVGKGVFDLLGNRVSPDIKKNWIYQPQAHLKGGYGPQLRKCYRFCSG